MRSGIWFIRCKPDKGPNRNDLMTGFLAYHLALTNGQTEFGLSLDAQKLYLRHFLPKDGDVIGEVTEVRSRKDLADRPVLQAAIARCQVEGLTLAVAKLNRLSSEDEEIMAIYHQLDGRLFSADIPDLDQSSLTVFMSIANRAREMTALRSNQAVAARNNRKASVQNSNTPAVGWPIGMPVRNSQRKQPNTRLASEDAIRAIESLRGEGAKPMEIAKRLNEQGHRTRRGRRFFASTVRRIIARTAID